MSLFGGMDASASGLTAERLRLDLIASNLANVDTVGTATTAPYRSELPVFSAVVPAPGAPPEVEVTAIVPDTSPFPVQHEPGNPAADANGNVRLPNVNVVNQMVDMLGASRAYQANATALDAAKQTMNSALNIGQ